MSQRHDVQRLFEHLGLDPGTYCDLSVRASSARSAAVSAAGGMIEAEQGAVESEDINCVDRAREPGV